MWCRSVSIWSMLWFCYSFLLNIWPSESTESCYYSVLNDDPARLTCSTLIDMCSLWGDYYERSLFLLRNSTVGFLCIWSLFVFPILLIHRWIFYYCSHTCAHVLYNVHPRVDLLFEDFLRHWWFQNWKKEKNQCTFHRQNGLFCEIIRENTNNIHFHKIF